MELHIHVPLMSGEKQLGFEIVGGKGHCAAPHIDLVATDSPAFRSGLQCGDALLSVNDVSVQDMEIPEIVALLQQCIPQQQVTLKIQREQQSAPRPPITPQGTPIMSHVKVQNGYKDEPETNPSLLKVARLNSLDLQRVHSDALPKHMVASKVYTSVEGSYKELASNDIAELLPDNVATEMTGSSVDTDSHHTLSSAGGIDSVSHLEASHSQEESLLQEIANAKDFSFSNDYFSQGHYHSSPQRDSPSPTSPQIMRSGSGKSQSSSQLSTVSPILVGHRRTNTYSHTYYPQEKSRSQAKKTESLPIFKSHTLDKKHCHSDSSGSGMGLNLTNLSLEDVHSASKLQIDQIWQEVEKSTTGMDSPTTEDVPTAIDPTAIQIPNNNWSNEMEVDLSSSSSPYHQGYGRRDEKDVEDSIGTSSLTNRNAPERTSSVKTIESRDIDTLLNTLRSLNEKVGTYDEEDEFKMLEELLQSNKFKKAKEFHDRMKAVVTLAPEAPQPHVRRILPPTRFIRHTLRETLVDRTSEVEELRKLLRKPHVQSVLFCHDKLATHDLYVPSTYFPRSAQDQEDIILSHSAIDLQTASLYVSREAPLSRDVPSSRKENATIVYLQRSNRPLGCTIYKQGDAVYVGKLLKGCDAEQSGVLREGDELLEINGIALLGKSTDEIIRMMSGEAGKVLVFTLIPVHDDTADEDYEEKYVRAHFGYNGELDDEVPCKELALNFTKGDILEVSNQDDPDWWQARKVFDDGGESLPGLIPGRHLQQKREVLHESYAVSRANEERNRRKGILSKLSRKKKKKIYYNQSQLTGAFQSVGHEVATYEDVVKLMPDINRRRPIVLIGAPSVGRRTLMKKLVESNSRHYTRCVAHTNRPPKAGEANGRDYIFVSREEMEADIHHGLFLEYGESKGYLYGISVKSVKSAIERGKAPVLDLKPQSLKIIGSMGLIPYIIFVASPRLERLQMTRKVTSEKRKKKIHTSVSVDGLDLDSRSFTEAELLQLYHASQEIKAEYSHYFDWVIVNDDFQVASDMLIEVARRIEEEPQWIPSSWVEEV